MLPAARGAVAVVDVAVFVAAFTTIATEDAIEPSTAVSEVWLVAIALISIAPEPAATLAAGIARASVIDVAVAREPAAELVQAVVTLVGCTAEVLVRRFVVCQSFACEPLELGGALLADVAWVIREAWLVTMYVVHGHLLDDSVLELAEAQLTTAFPGLTRVQYAVLLARSILVTPTLVARCHTVPPLMRYQRPCDHCAIGAQENLFSGARGLQ